MLAWSASLVQTSDSLSLAMVLTTFDHHLGLSTKYTHVQIL
jgi:hypothetical protein